MNSLVKSLAPKFVKLQVLTLRQNYRPQLEDDAVETVARYCHDLRHLDLSKGLKLSDRTLYALAHGYESVIALANGCPHLRSLGLYYCQNITDRAMYSLANSHARNDARMWQNSSHDQEGLVNLNISQCTALTPPAVQAVCDSFPGLHTCPGRHSLIISGCLSLTSVHCGCTFQTSRAGGATLAADA
ncbi:hypothetical protein B296_00049092 [Ensete ventricosum]|uniref:Uncharacterized protein n=1 Tax=Ensete ventricosum TaxID=4639 RepID=A0A426YS99_ENSVE|nr:hypothetical protein B296_00049092 [Ensete ventricosum]